MIIINKIPFCGSRVFELVGNSVYLHYDSACCHELSTEHHTAQVDGTRTFDIVHLPSATDPILGLSSMHVAVTMFVEETLYMFDVGIRHPKQTSQRIFGPSAIHRIGPGARKCS